MLKVKYIINFAMTLKNNFGRFIWLLENNTISDMVVLGVEPTQEVIKLSSATGSNSGQSGRLNWTERLVVAEIGSLLLLFKWWIWLAEMSWMNPNIFERGIKLYF